MLDSFFVFHFSSIKKVFFKGTDIKIALFTVFSYFIEMKGTFF